MNKKLLLLFISVTLMLACDMNNGQRKSKAQKPLTAKDSLQKVWREKPINDIALWTALQDSIYGLGPEKTFEIRYLYREQVQANRKRRLNNDSTVLSLEELEDVILNDIREYLHAKNRNIFDRELSNIDK